MRPALALTGIVVVLFREPVQCAEPLLPPEEAHGLLRESAPVDTTQGAPLAELVQPLGEWSFLSPAASERARLLEQAGQNFFEISQATEWTQMEPLGRATYWAIWKALVGTTLETFLVDASFIKQSRMEMIKIFVGLANIENRFTFKASWGAGILGFDRTIGCLMDDKLVEKFHHLGPTILTSIPDKERVAIFDSLSGLLLEYIAARKGFYPSLDPIVFRELATRLEEALKPLGAKGSLEINKLALTILKRLHPFGLLNEMWRSAVRTIFDRVVEHFTETLSLPQHDFIHYLRVDQQSLTLRFTHAAVTFHKFGHDDFETYYPASTFDVKTSVLEKNLNRAREYFEQQLVEAVGSKSKDLQFRALILQLLGAELCEPSSIYDLFFDCHELRELGEWLERALLQREELGHPEWCKQLDSYVDVYQVQLVRYLQLCDSLNEFSCSFVKKGKSVMTHVMRFGYPNFGQNGRSKALIDISYNTIQQGSTKGALSVAGREEPSVAI